MLVGAMAVGLLVEKSNLHLRISLRLMTLMGEKIGSLLKENFINFNIQIWVYIETRNKHGCSWTAGLHLAGFMLVTWFLSMWMSNVAAAALMLPSVEALLKQYHQPKGTLLHPFTK